MLLTVGVPLSAKICNIKDFIPEISSFLYLILALPQISGVTWACNELLFGSSFFLICMCFLVTQVNYEYIVIMGKMETHKRI